MKTAKRWCIAFVAILLAVIIFIGSMNYFIDPYGYFRFQGGNYFELNDDYYTRVLKAERIKHFSDEFDGYVIGGSKASGIRADSLKEYDGHDYYNSYIQSGNFEEYEKYINYILENDSDVKKIFLHISSIEVKQFSRQDQGDTYKTPAQVNGTSKIAEVCKMLMKNLSVTFDEIEKIKKDKTNPVAYPELKTGERNIGKYYDAVSIDPEWFEKKYVLYEQTNKQKAKGEAPIEYNFDYRLSLLFNQTLDQADNMEKCLTCLRNIKAACDAKAVELQVVFGPSFVSEMAVFDGPEFWNFYGEVVKTVGNVWDFSDYNDISLNPYNFYNYGHFFYDVGDLMIKTMKENKEIYKGDDDTIFSHFGAHVFSNAYDAKADGGELSVSVAEYIAARENQYNALRDEYLKTGTIKLEGYDDTSNLVKGSKYFDDEELQAREGRDDKIYKKYEKTKNDYDENVVISTPDNAATAAPDDSDVLDSFKDDGEPDDEPLEEED